MLTEHRRCVAIRPFKEGEGPSFILHMFTTDDRSKPRPCIGYRLDQHDHGHEDLVLFEGDEYRPSPLEMPFGDGSAIDLLHELVAGASASGPCAHMRYFAEHYALPMLCKAGEMLEVEPIVSSVYPPPHEA